MLGKKKKPGDRSPQLGIKARWGAVVIEIFLFLIWVAINPAVAQAPQDSEAQNAARGQIVGGIKARKFPFSLQWAVEGAISQDFTRSHPGIDIETKYGQPVQPVGPGIVIENGWETGYGRVVLIKHEGNFSSMYAHLSQSAVSVGEKVGAETEIGKIGMTGWTTGPHLHLEIYEEGKVLDPKSLLPKPSSDE